MAEKSSLLVVDDERGPREALRMILKDRYEVTTAENAIHALEYINKKSFDVAIIDIQMAGMDGVQLLREIKEVRPEIEVILMTAYASIETAKSALQYGALDYLIKPFDQKDIIGTVEKGIAKRGELLRTRLEIEKLQFATTELTKEIENAKQSIEQHYTSTVKALLAAIDAKDQYTRGHSERVSKFAAFLAEKVGFSNDNILPLEQAALIHDIGKIGIDKNILNKQGALNPSELREIKKHPLVGSKIIASVEFLHEMIPVVLYHHERFDGTGFPEGLKGASIPLCARVVSIADAVDAMLCNRPYRSALAMDHVRREISSMSGRQFDPDIVSVVLSGGLIECYMGLFDYQHTGR